MGILAAIDAIGLMFTAIENERRCFRNTVRLPKHACLDGIQFIPSCYTEVGCFPSHIAKYRIMLYNYTIIFLCQSQN